MYPGLNRRAVDFRTVQGAVAADGVGHLLIGLAGTMPIVLRPNGAAMIEITGISSRYIGVALGAVLIVLACLPKALAVVLAIPGPVIAAFITITMATIFIIGTKVILQGGLDYRGTLIAGISFWVGVGFQNGAIFPEHVSGFAGGLLQNGMMAGGFTAIAMTALMELTKPRPSRIEVECDLSALSEIREFIGAFASRSGWDEAMAARLDAAGEETLLTLLDQEEAGKKPERRRLLLVRAQRGRRCGPRVRRLERRGEPSGPDRAARRGERRGYDRTGSVAPAVASPCVLGSPSAIPRHGYCDRPCGTARGEARPKAVSRHVFINPASNAPEARIPERRRPVRPIDSITGNNTMSDITRRSNYIP